VREIGCTATSSQQEKQEGARGTSEVHVVRRQVSSTAAMMSTALRPVAREP
jgi:hypothetical protein